MEICLGLVVPLLAVFRDHISNDHNDEDIFVGKTDGDRSFHNGAVHVDRFTPAVTRLATSLIERLARPARVIVDA